MTINFTLDDALISKAIQAGHHETAEEAIFVALKEYVNRLESPSQDASGRSHPKILDWVGKVDYYEDYDHKELRRRKIR
jgi:hypothetical protein